uniref:Uncharacterized protein n=1 Tax=Manihot esculenta TaxID=3983 RepID=A0A2C9VWX7_MANES
MHIVLPPLLSECLNWKKKTRRKIAEFLTFSVFFSSAFAYAVECFSFCQCLKFKADQAQDAKKMEKLNSNFFTLMSRGPQSGFYLLPLDQHLLTLTRTRVSFHGFFSNLNDGGSEG